MQAQLGATLRDWLGDAPASRSAVRRALGGSVKVAEQDASPQPPATIDETLVVHQPAQALYAFWRDVENLPTLFRLIDDVDAEDFLRSRWVLRSPSGETVACDVEIFDEREDEWLAFRSTGGEIAISGRVLFEALTPLRTALHVTIHVSPADADQVAQPHELLVDDFAEQMRADLRAFKRAMETGGLLPVSA
jgi:uncharacterized membrane protein